MAALARVQLRRAVQNLVRFPGMVLHCTSSVVGSEGVDGPSLRLGLTRPDDGATCTLVSGKLSGAPREQLHSYRLHVMGSFFWAFVIGVDGRGGGRWG